MGSPSSRSSVTACSGLGWQKPISQRQALPWATPTASASWRLLNPALPRARASFVRSMEMTILLRLGLSSYCLIPRDTSQGIPAVFHLRVWPVIW